MSFVSYAQNFEDVMLWRALKHIRTGFYIDVGANDPKKDSVTHSFYDRGWRGINVEPVAEWFKKLEEQRPHDINLQVAVSSTAGDRPFFDVKGTGLSTLVENEAQRAAAGGWTADKVTVPCLTLEEIWSRHADGDVHFLKIDVEGAELDVLNSIDLRRRRPWILVVEATRPQSMQTTHETFEPVILAAGYRFVYFDGLNRFYVADERAGELASYFAVPPNVFDDFIRVTEHEAKQELERLRAILPMQISHFEQEMTVPEGGGTLKFSKMQFPFLDFDSPLPTLENPGSQLCTSNQFKEPAYTYWCEQMRQPVSWHRKQWEFVYVLEILQRAGMLRQGARGLGFGCGQEPVPAVLAKFGCHVVATDLDTDDAAGKGWIETGQHSRKLEDLNLAGICPHDDFMARVRFQPADMNAIAANLRDFDFLWSSCAFEHLGSISHGLNFVVNALDCLRPGGIAVHTTEFNLTSNFKTVESTDLSVFRRHDMERLATLVDRAGGELLPINFNPGTTPVDCHYDLPPYRAKVHLKIQLGNYVLTSIGLVVRKRA